MICFSCRKALKAIWIGFSSVVIWANAGIARLEAMMAARNLKCFFYSFQARTHAYLPALVDWPEPTNGSLYRDLLWRDQSSRKTAAPSSWQYSTLRLCG